MSSQNFDVLIAGAGIIGLATGYALLTEKPGLRIAIIEKESNPAQHQTGHNSGVIHSGIYYKPGSLKAKNCMDGYKRLLAFCETHKIPYELCGKIIVATSEEEIPRLEKLYERGLANGLDRLTYLNAAEIKEHEPYSAGIKAIHVPQTGIVDYKEVCKVLCEEIVKKGGQIFYDERVTALIDHESDVAIQTSNKSYKAQKFVNCAGLYSDKIAKLQIPDLNVRIIPFRGEYYELKTTAKHKVKNLIYPVPDPAFPFLGVHFTRRVDGLIEAGPNAVFAMKREGYKKSDINLKELWDSLSWPGFIIVAAKYWKTGFGEIYRSFSKSAFTRALQKLMPELNKSDLIPSGAGVRAQACEKDGKLLDDFCIEKQGACIHVLNAPSPAATSSLSIGHKIAQIVLDIKVEI